VALDAVEAHQAAAMVPTIAAVIIHQTAATVPTIAAVENKFFALNKMSNFLLICNF
jgi:hypothetical protein